MVTPEQIWPISAQHDTKGTTGGARARPPDWPPGWHVEIVAETGSTNADLLDAAARGAPDRSVVLAAHQTAGRGRLDRRWEAPPGANLLVSMLFRDVPDPAVRLTHRVGLAAVAVVEQLAGRQALLKWPNDVMIEDRKLAGILAQRATDGSVVVGLGMNLGWAPEGAARLGDEFRPPQVLMALLEAFDALTGDLMSAYRRALGTLGRQVRVDLPGGVLDGVAQDVDAQGRLILRDLAGETHRVDVGDVVHLRPVT